jgi:LEA14-like dessication related protein
MGRGVFLIAAVAAACAHPPPPAPAPARVEKPAPAPTCYGALTEVRIVPLSIKDVDATWDDIGLVARFRVDNPKPHPVTVHDWNGAIASIDGLQATEIENVPVKVPAESCEEVQLRLSVRYTHALNTVALEKELELRVSPAVDDGLSQELRVRGRPRLRQAPYATLGTIEVARHRDSADVMFPIEIINPNPFPMKLESAEVTPMVFNNPLRRVSIGPAELNPGEHHPYKLQSHVEYEAVNGLASTPLRQGSLEISVDITGTMVLEGHAFPIATGHINNARYVK